MSDYIDITTLKSKITPKLHGATLNKLVGDFYDKLREAAAATMARIDPPDTIYVSRINNALYDKVYNYTCPPFLKNPTRFVDIRPIGPRSKWDDNTGTFGKSFDLKKKANTFTVEMVNGVKTLRVNEKYLPAQILLVDLNSINIPQSATVIGTGDAQNLTIDTLDYVTSSGSLTFGLSGATGIGIITITLPVAVDLSNLLNLGSLFEWIKFPDATRLTNVQLSWGNSASAYWQQTVTVPQGRTAFDTNAWDLLANDWTTATKTGSPDPAQITFLQITFNYTTGAALTSVKIDSVTASLGKAYEAVFYDSRIFKDASTGALKSKPTSDSDLITLDESAFNIYLYECLRVILPEIRGKNSATDLAEIKELLDGDGRVIRGTLVMNRVGLYRDYVSQNPSQAIPPQEEFYDFDDSINQDDSRINYGRDRC